MAPLDLLPDTPIMSPQKPKSQNGDLTNLSPALAPLCQLPHWVLWQWEWRPRTENWTKPPFMLSGAKAESDNPLTWSSHAKVVEKLQRSNGSFDGIGFVVKGVDDMVFVDLDQCLDRNGQPDAWAQVWLEAANGSYVERTPSGKGLRIIGVCSGASLQRKWTIPDACDGAAIEIYRNCARYVTVTGAQIGECTKLQPIDADKIVKHYDALKGSWKSSTQSKKKKTAEPKTEGGQLDFNQASASINYDDIIQNGAPNGSRSEYFQAVVWHLAAQGKTIKEIATLLERHPNGIGAKYSGRLHTEVGRSYKKWQEQRQPPPPPDVEPDEPDRWETVDKNGKPQPTPVNTRRGLNKLVRCRYDAFHNKYLVEGPLVDQYENLDQIVQVLRVKVLKAYGFEPTTQSTRDGLIQLCLKNKFDPVCDYLDALVWDGLPRLDRWLVTYTGAEDSDLNREFGRIALIAAVRRARYPGTKFDPILVLEGQMGTGKSTVFVTLAGVENHSDQTILGKQDREQQELLGGVWIFEIADLAGMKKAEVEHLKAFASRTHDRARGAYGFFRDDQPRRGIVAATTNHDQYLKEADRRFWPVKTTTVDIPALKRDRDQLWAEAAQREREGASIVLRQELWSAAGSEQLAREEGDPWDDILVEAVGTIEQGEERISNTDLLSIVLKIDASRQKDFDFKRLKRRMMRLGWTYQEKTMRIAGKPTRGYTRPAKT